MLDFDLFLRMNNLKQNTVAEYLGVNQSRISHYIKQGTMPVERLQKLINNPFGWDTSMIALKDAEPVPEDEDYSNTKVISVSEFADFTRQVIFDYQKRLTDKDNQIKELISSVIAQNQILNSTIEKMMSTFHS